RATAGELDLIRGGKQAIPGAADPVHDVFGEAPLQQLDHGIDGAGTVPADRLPALRGDRRDRHLDFIEICAAHQPDDFALGDLQVEYAAVAHVVASARQPAGIVAVALEVRAPSHAPEAGGDLIAREDDRRDRLPLLPHRGELALRLAAPLCHADIGAP